LEQSEVQTLVEELETRVERLRSLYEQYFMGIEKIEPAVPRKDVERRLYVLRRTQIRNTGLRFRFQNALLRYNTYQTYWIRICRQIEEGTYKRDLRRANARFAMPARPKTASQIDPRELKGEAPTLSFERDEGEDVEVDFEVDEAAPDPKLEEDPKPKEEPRLHEEELLEQLQARAVFRPVGAPPASPADRASPLALPRSPAAVAIHAPLPGAGGMRYVQGGPARVAPPANPPPSPVRPAAPPPLATPRAKTMPPPLPPRPSASQAGRPGDVSGDVPPARKSRPKMVRVEAPAIAREAAPERAAVRDDRLSEERVRQIYSQYVDAKRARQESTASLTYENLAKSLRESSDKLRQKHTGKTVDFEVTVKDGRTILRPIVK
jgi:hypothetical protein